MEFSLIAAKCSGLKVPVHSANTSNITTIGQQCKIKTSSYEAIDKALRRQAEASKEKDKKRRAETSSRRSHGKRTTDDNVNLRSPKRYRDRDGYHGKYNDRLQQID